MITQDALDILHRCKADSTSVTLPDEQLERSLYDQVNEVLTRLGGKWNKKSKAHIFPYDPQSLLAAVLETRQMPPKNPTAFFPTPSTVVDMMLDAVHIDWRTNIRVLEPSAGTGAIAKAIRARNPKAEIHCCEFLDVNRQVLINDGFDVVANDFMDYKPDKPYDIIVMNPPFSLDGDSTAYITHVNHAWRMLSETGEFAAVVPPGFMTSTTKKQSEFREWVCDWLEIDEIGAGVFKESGTMINTLMISGEKRSGAWRRGHQNGWNSYHAWNACLWLENDYGTYMRLRATKDRESFNREIESAISQLHKQFIPVVLRNEDVDELYEWFMEP